MLPAAEKRQGFKAALFLTDSSTGRAISVSLWETESAMKAGETSGYFEEQVARFVDLFTTPPVRESYEVSAVTMSP